MEKPGIISFHIKKTGISVDHRLNMHQCDNTDKKKISGVSDFINGSITATLRIPQCKCCVSSSVPHVRRTLTTKYVSRGRDRMVRYRTLYPTGNI